MFLQVEDGQEIVSFADEEGAALLRRQSHAMISAAGGNGILHDDAVILGIDDGEALGVLQVDVNKFCNWVVLRHPSFAVEMERLDDGVGADVNYSFCLATFVRDVEFVKRRGIGAAIGLGLGLELLDDFSLGDVDYADGVVA